MYHASNCLTKRRFGGKINVVKGQENVPAEPLENEIERTGKSLMSLSEYSLSKAEVEIILETLENEFYYTGRNCETPDVEKLDILAELIAIFAG